MNKETIYLVYSYRPGEAFHDLWYAKSLETAELLRDMEFAWQYNLWYDCKGLWGDISWERYVLECGAEFKIMDVEVWE